MLTIAVSSFLLIALTVLLHYEVLRALNRFLPVLDIPNRFKLLVALFSAFMAHLAEMAIYGAAIFALIKYAGIGDLKGFGPVSLLNCIYFSAETFTSLGFGDIAPVGPIRLLAGLEALNGLLLIGWSASYITVAMERFWRAETEQ
ncbi:MAG: Ion transport 2 domain protein [Polaromonas sp.]|nr:Ion transport 2 domain protein [Polaromonas sp.]